MTHAQVAPRLDQARHAEEAYELNAVRVLLETQGARDAALYADDDETLRELRQLAVSSAPEAGPRFHVLVAAAGGNRAMTDMLEEVLGRLVTLVGQEASCGDPTTACAAHQALLDAIMSGREGRAAELVKSHVCAAQLATLHHLSARAEQRPVLVAI